MTQRQSNRQTRQRLEVGDALDLRDTADLRPAEYQLQFPEPSHRDQAPENNTTVASASVH